MIWSDFFPYVLPSVMGCPAPVAEFNIRQAAIEFCRKTLAYTYTTDPVLTDGINLVYDLEYPMATVVVKPMAVAVAGRDYLLVDSQRGNQLVRQESIAEFAFFTDKDSIHINPVRDAGDEIVVDLTLAPSINAKGLDDAIAKPYAQEIAYGALASIFMLPKQEWSDTNMAVANRMLFKQRTDTLAMHFARGQAAAKLRSFPNFF